MIRIFMGFSKSDGLDVEQTRRELAQVLVERDGVMGRQPREYVVITGTEDCAANRERAGGWDEWCRDVVTRLTPARRPFFDALIIAVPPIDTFSVLVGKATGLTCEEALKAKRPLHLFDQSREPSTALQLVTRAGPRDANDFKRGWELHLK